MSPHPGIPAISLRLLLIAGAIACASDAPVAPESAAFELVAIRPTSLEGEVGTPVDPVPAVRVVDAQGRRRAGVTVRFLAAHGSVAANEAISDADGIANPGEWVLGRQPGVHTLRATVDGHATVSFSASARAAPPATVELNWSGSELVLPEEDGGLLLAIVTDRFGNRLSGVTVEFTLREGDQVINGATPRAVVTDANGVADGGRWTLGSGPGAYSVEARAEGLEPAHASVLMLDPATITWFGRITPSSSEFLTFAHHDIGFVDLDACGDAVQAGYVLERALYLHDLGGTWGIAEDRLSHWGTYVVGPRSVDGRAPVTVWWEPKSIEKRAVEGKIDGILHRGSLGFDPLAGWPWSSVVFTLPDQSGCGTRDRSAAGVSVYDMEALITISDPAWGDLANAIYSAVVELRPDRDGTGVLTGLFKNFRLSSAEGVQQLETRAARGALDGAGAIVITLDEWSSWHMRGDVLPSGDITGIIGCCGHIGGTFTLKRR